MMREDICSIPVSEVFEPKDGCPLCRLRDVLEERMTDYITGSIMAAPVMYSTTRSSRVLRSRQIGQPSRGSNTSLIGMLVISSRMGVTLLFLNVPVFTSFLSIPHCAILDKMKRRDPDVGGRD